MSFGLSRGRDLDPGPIAVSADELPPLPDDMLTNRAGARVDIRRWFADPSRPLEIEIGSGKGTFILSAAQASPATNFLGIEYAHEFYLYAADRLRRAAVPNVRMLSLDAGEFVHWRVPDACASVIHLYFADPWPKAKHHRRRMIQDRFLADARRVLTPGGELRVVTDHADYWAWMEEHFARWATPELESPGAATPVVPVAPAALAPDGGPLFERRAFVPPAGIGEGELVGTNFERKYRREGRQFHSAVLVKPPRS